MNKELWKVIGPVGLIVVVAFAVAYRFIEPAPPRSFTLAAGSADGAYYHFAQRYRALLAAEGISVEVLETSGSVENVALLADSTSGVDAALVQTGIPIPDLEERAIVGLAGLYYEPLWLFVADHNEPVTLVTDLHGLRVGAGKKGSGTWFVTRALLSEHGMDESNVALLPLGGSDAIAALEDGQLDALFAVGSLDSTYVSTLLERDDLVLAHLEMTSALSRRLPYLVEVSVARGLLDPGQDFPSEPLTVLAPVASLAATTDFHPALIDLLLMVASDVHQAGDLLTPPDLFPAARPTAAPVSPEAERFFTSGLPFLKRVLPFWAANLVSRMWVMIIPLLTILIPLARIIPPTYHWRLRSQLFRLYRRLKAVDAERVQNKKKADQAALLNEIAAIEEEVEQLTVPLSYADRVYHLKLHIHFVRDQLMGDTAVASGTRDDAEDGGTE